MSKQVKQAGAKMPFSKHCVQATVIWTAHGNTGYAHLSIQIILLSTNALLNSQVDAEVGQAIRESGIPRSEIFITSKFWPNFAAPAHVATSLELVLRNTGLDYIDLFLAHWPVAVEATADFTHARAFPAATAADLGVVPDPDTGRDKLDLRHCPRNVAAAAGATGSFVPTWAAMKGLVHAGKACAVGVSNFAVGQLQELLPHADDVPLSCNQVEAHPWLPNDELLGFMRENGILAAVYSPFAGQSEGGGKLVEEPVVRQVAERNDMDVGQALQSWAVMRGTIPLGKSQTPARIRSNLAVRRLPDRDFDALSGLRRDDEESRTIDYSDYFGVKFFV